MVTDSPPPSLTLRQRLNVSRWALAHQRLTILAWLFIGVGGLFAALRLPVAMFPDIVFPVVVVSVDAPGLGAEEVERTLTIPVETSLLPLTGRTPLTSVVSAGRTVVTVQFAVGIGLDEAEEQVRARLAGLVLAPPAHVAIHRVDLNEAPVVTYAVLPGAAADAAQRLDTMARQLGAVDGVARVITLGLAGSVRAPAAAPATAPGAPLAPAAAGVLAPAPAPAPGTAPTRVRFNGAPAWGLQVVKRAQANTLEVAKALDLVIQANTADGALRAVAVRAEAPFIREATGATIEALWAAVALSVLVIYPFLRSLRATAISALAIPTSLFGTFLVMSLAGFKFETITLLALALVIGIVIDDAIVDVENIARHLPRTPDARTAVLLATDEIGLTVTAATLTIVAVFVPVALMGGTVGTFFRPFGLTISAAVLTSLLVARTLAPVLAARWLRPEGARAPAPAWERFRGAYQKLLALGLRHPGAVLLVAALSLAAGIALIPIIPKGFLPALDRGECDVRFTLRPGAGLAAADAAAERLAARIGADPDVINVFAVAGTTLGNPDQGLLHVELRRDRGSTTQAVETRLRLALEADPQVRVSVENLPIIAVAAAQPLEITLTGDDDAALHGAARRVLAQLAQWPGVADVTVAGIGADGDGTWLRRETHPAAVVRANLAGGAALGTVGDRVMDSIPGLLPPGVHLALAGESADAADVFGHFATALVLSLAGVLVVLLLLFRSWRDPLAIAVALPLSAVGALLGMFVARTDFGIVSLLGLVFLTGLASKNAIILVDRIKQLRADGLDRDRAILEAGAVRLRPIVMTTAAAVLGMLPIALGWGAGAEMRAPMAIAIIGGLLTSTLLSLVVVPVVYRLLDRRPR